MEFSPATTPGIGYASNGGSQRYLIEAESTTGFIAWKLADETILISESKETSIRPSHHITFWSCTSYTDSTPDGDITLLDCHDNGLSILDVRGLGAIRLLDCCHNNLNQLDVSSLTELEVLNVDHNELTSLDIRALRSLRLLTYASNQIQEFKHSGLENLQVIDSSHNPI